MISRRIFALGLTLALTACAQTSPESTTSNWQNRTWYLWSIDGAPTTPGTMRKASLEFDATGYRYGGFCNSVSGPYTYGPGSALDMSTGISTIIGCPDPNEDIYFAHMGKVRSLTEDGIELVLVTSEAIELRFRSPI